MLQLNASSASGNMSIGRKTSYNWHFPRSFLLKYGPALQDPTDNAILNRLRSWNCEWLSRLNIAISELPMTTKDNMPLIRQFHGTLFCDQFLDDLLSSFDHLLPALSRLDNKDKTDQTPPSREDVVSLLRNLDQDTDLRQCIMDGFNAGGLLMMLVTQVLAIQTLMRNAEDFADKVSKEAQHQPFKEDPSPRGMRSYILNSITKKRRNMRMTLRSRRGQGLAGASSSTPGMKTGVRNSPVLHKRQCRNGGKRATSLPDFDEDEEDTNRQVFTQKDPKIPNKLPHTSTPISSLSDSSSEEDEGRAAALAMNKSPKPVPTAATATSKVAASKQG